MTDMQLVPLAETMQLGEVLARSGFFKDGRDASQAVVKVLAGREIGIGPIASMAGIYIVEGKVSIGSNLMAAAVKRSGKYDYTVVKLDNTQAVIMFWQKNPKTGEFAELGESSFSIAEAQAAGVAGKQVWKAYPRNMLFARAISNGVRWYCPDIFGGAPVYAPEELGATVDGETGEVIDIQPARVVTVEQPRQEYTLETARAAIRDAANDAAFEAMPSASLPADRYEGGKVERGANGKATPASTRPEWHDKEDAIAWGFAQGCFDHANHAENAWNKIVTAVKAEHAPKIPTYAQVFDAWHADVMRRVVDHNAKIDAALDAQAAGDELPVFESR